MSTPHQGPHMYLHIAHINIQSPRFKPYPARLNTVVSATTDARGRVSRVNTGTGTNQEPLGGGGLARSPEALPTHTAGLLDAICGDFVTNLWGYVHGWAGLRPPPLEHIGAGLWLFFLNRASWKHMLGSKVF